METICGADCTGCAMKDSCGGCVKTGGCPFGEPCIAAQYIKLGGMESYKRFKDEFLGEINALLKSLDIPGAEKLYELQGSYVNLEYPIPSGKTVKLLDDKKIYLGCQIELGDMGVCYGVVADAGFILICSYSVNGSEPEIVLYKRR